MTAEELGALIDDMNKDTQAGRLKWRLEVATSEYLPPEKKPVVGADGKQWTVDECYVAYSCTFRKQDFIMITYENIEKSENAIRTTNMVYLPPIAMRVFRLDELSPYAVQTTGALMDKLHRLWNTLLRRSGENPEQVEIDAREIQ